MSKKLRRNKLPLIERNIAFSLTVYGCRKGSNDKNPLPSTSHRDKKNSFAIDQDQEAYLVHHSNSCCGAMPLHRIVMNPSTIQMLCSALGHWFAYALCV